MRSTLLGLPPQITWALEPKKPATLSLQDTDLVSGQSWNTHTDLTLRLGSSKLEYLSSEL